MNLMMTLAALATSPNVPLAPGAGAGADATNQWVIRDFDSEFDKVALDEICSNSFKNSDDYLPRIVSKYVEDSDCRFVMLAQNGPNTGANEQSFLGLAEGCLNCRNLGDRVGFIEAVRIRPGCRGKGLGKILLSKVATEEQERNEYDNLLSCTVKNNYAMQKVFDQVGFQKITILNGLDFSALRKIPGWSAHDKDVPCTLSLTSALGIKDAIDETAMNDVSRWELARSIQGVRDILKKTTMSPLIREYDCIPGLYEGIGLESKGFATALSEGLVFTLRDSDDNGTTALVALVRDARIGSMKSSYVMSVVGSCSRHLESAIGLACSETVQRTLRELTQRENEFIGFGVMFEGSLHIRENLRQLLPLMTDYGIIYGKSLRR